MKHIVRYRIMNIPKKIQCDLRISVDEHNVEYASSFEGGKGMNVTLFPIISVSIVRPAEIDENGRRVRAPTNRNDSLGMTKFTLPIFMEELKGIKEDMKTPELYTYHGKRLELNDHAAEKIRRVFMIGDVTLELSAVVIAKDDDSRVEGIKMKFNNEESTVLLTLNELASLIYTLDHMNIDILAFTLFKTYVSPNNKNKITEFSSDGLKGAVDIIPKADFN